MTSGSILVYNSNELSCRQGGAIVKGLAAFAKHGDSYAQALVTRLLQSVYVPLLEMIRAWIFEGQLLTDSSEFFVARNAGMHAMVFTVVYRAHVCNCLLMP